jgi:hypothetical protein
MTAVCSRVAVAIVSFVEDRFQHGEEWIRRTRRPRTATFRRSRRRESCGMKIPDFQLNFDHCSSHPCALANPHVCTPQDRGTKRCCALCLPISDVRLWYGAQRGQTDHRHCTLFAMSLCIPWFWEWDWKSHPYFEAGLPGRSSSVAAILAPKFAIW